MAEIKVWEVASRSDRREFVRLPFREYANDPNWVPPLLMTQEELLGFRKHAFHEYAKVTNFLASRDGHVVGRITAIVNSRHNERLKRSVASSASLNRSTIEPLRMHCSTKHARVSRRKA